MASGRSKTERPAWQKTLFTVPPAQCSISQACFFKSIKYIDAAVNILCDPNVCTNLNANDPKVLKALWLFTCVVIDESGFPCLDYYISPKVQSQIWKSFHTLFYGFYNVWSSNNPSDDPEILVPFTMTATLFLGMYLREIYSHRIPRTDLAQALELSAKRARVNVSSSLLLATEDPLIKSKCDEYLRSTLGPLDNPNMLFILDTANPMEEAREMLYAGLYSVHVSTYLPVAAFPIFETNLYTVSLDKLCDELTSLSASGTQCGSSSTLFIHSGSLEALSFLIKRLSESHIYLVRSASAPVAPSDPLEVKWRKASDAYFKYMKYALKEAENEAPSDFYAVATINRLILTAMLSGVSKSVCYSQIEAVCNEMKIAADACATWAPPLWKLEIETDRKIVFEDVLPFLRNANPSSYKTASVDVFTPGFLEFYTPITVYQRLYGNRLKTCDACGITAIDLLKCQACNSTYYCDRECQKQDWKNHKVACKEMQRARGAV